MHQIDVGFQTWSIFNRSCPLSCYKQHCVRYTDNFHHHHYSSKNDQYTSKQETRYCIGSNLVLILLATEIYKLCRKNCLGFLSWYDIEENYDCWIFLYNGIPDMFKKIWGTQSAHCTWEQLKFEEGCSVHQQVLNYLVRMQSRNSLDFRSCFGECCCLLWVSVRKAITEVLQ